jgi:proteasome beta subunit
MTVLTGIICKDGIVMGADTLWTEFPSGTKSFGDKLISVEFSGDHVLIGQAGVRPLANRVVRILQSNAIGIRIKEAKDVEDAIEASVREMKGKMDDSQRQSAEDQETLLLAAFYVKGQPCLRSFRVTGHGAGDRPSKFFEACGAGAPIAHYILSELAVPKAEAEVGAVQTIYAILKAKQHNAWCGGETTIKTLLPVPQNVNGFTFTVGAVIESMQEVVNKTERHLAVADEKAKESRNKKMTQAIKRVVANEWMKRAFTREK